MTRLHILSTFGLTTLVTNYWGLMMPYQSPIIVFAAVVVVLLWASWRFPLLRTLTLIALIAVVPIPIASGHHVMSERFTYLPAMFASLLYTALLWFFIKDAKPQVQLAAGALIINAALWRWPQAWSPDIGSTIMILLLTLLVGYVFYRIQWIAAPVLGWLVSVAVLSQVSIFLSDPGPMVCGLLALTIGGALAQKSGTWPGIVISAALWYAPHFSLPLFLFAAAGQGQGLLIKNRLSFLPFLSDRPVNTIHLTQEIDSLEQK